MTPTAVIGLINTSSSLPHVSDLFTVVYIV